MIPSAKVLFSNVRKSVKELTQAERDEFVARVLALNKDNKYTPFEKQNAENGPHNKDEFLPWYRYFLVTFEDALRKVKVNGKDNPNFTLPYWDFENDYPCSQDYVKSVIWKSTFMGGNGDPANDYIVKDTPFKDFDPKIRRKISDSGSMPQLPICYDVVKLLNDYPNAPPLNNYVRFRLQLEELAKNVLKFVGGDSNKFDTAANDPVFWLILCSIDRIWAYWQTINSAEATTKTTTYPNLDDNLKPFLNSASKPLLARDVIDFTQFNRYQIYRWNKDVNTEIKSKSFSTPSFFVLNNLLFISFVGVDGKLYVSSSDDGNFQGYGTNILKKDSTIDKPATVVFKNKVFISFVGSTSAPQKLLISSSKDGLNFDNSMPILTPNSSTNGPSLAAQDNLIHIFFRGAADSGIYYASSSDGINWPVSATQILTTYQTMDSPSALLFDGKIYLAFQGQDKKLYVAVSDSGKWSEPKAVGTITITGTPRLVIFNQKLCILYQDENGHLNFINGSWDSDNVKSDNITGLSQNGNAFEFNFQVRVGALNSNSNQLQFYHTVLI